MSEALGILVVDDCPETCAGLERELRRGLPEFVVRHITGLGDLDRAHQDGQFHLVITDYQLHWTDGFSILQTIRENRPDCPVIMFTDQGNEEIAVQAMKAGFSDYIRKTEPGYQRLPDAIRAALEQAEQRVARERPEQEAGELPSMLRVAFDTNPDGLLLLDSQARLILANPIAQRLLPLLADGTDGEIRELGGYSLEELVMCPGQDSPRRELDLGRTEERVSEVEACPLPVGALGGGWLVVLHEVTESRKLWELVEARRRLDSVGQLAAGIAHDFNNILQGMIGYAELVLHAPGVPANVHSMLETIAQQGHRAAHLIRQMLDFSRKSISRQTPLDLKHLVNETVRRLEPSLPRHVRLTVDAPEDIYPVCVDVTQMREAITNVVLNARDAMPRGGLIHASLQHWRASRDGVPPFPRMEGIDWVLLRIADTGTGIPAEAQQHVFDPFFTTKEPGQGTGMGLAQTYGVVKQHEGFIDFETADGKGTTFLIYLPLASGIQRGTDDGTGRLSPQGHGQTILVVEDTTDVLSAMQKMLARLGYEVITAWNGLEALRVYEESDQKIDLVITDAVMPEMSGQTLVQQLHERGCAAKVIVFSGYPLQQGWRDTWGPNVVAWLSKPLQLRSLAQTIQQILSREAGKSGDEIP